MKEIKVGMVPPEFSLVDTRGNVVRLSDFKGNNPVLIVFNRGFA